MAQNNLASLIVSLEANIVKFQADMKTAADVAQNTFSLIESAAAGAKKGLLGIATGLASGISVGTFTHLITETITATAELDKMAQRTGATVEALSGLRIAARIVGTDMSTVEKGIGLLDKAMFNAATTGGKAKIAFDTLGISIKDSGGNLRDTDDVLLEIAKAFAGMENSSTKSALAMTFLGRAGRELIPVLNELGEQGDYQGKVTTRQAEIAEDLEKNFRRLGVSGREMKQVFVNEITPALDALVKSFLAFLNQTGGLRDTIKGLASDGSLQSWARQVGFALAHMSDAFHDAWEDFKGLAQFLGSFVSIGAGVVLQLRGIDLALQGKFTEGFATVRQGMDKIKEGYKEMSESLSKPPANSTQFRDNYLKALIEIDTAQEKLRNRPPPVPEGGVGKGIDPAAAFIAQLNQEAALQKQMDAAILTEAKQTQQEEIAIEKAAFDTRQISQIQFLESKLSKERAYATQSIGLAQQEVVAAQKRLGELVEINDTEKLSSRQQLEFDKAINAAVIEVLAAKEKLRQVTKAADIEALQGSTAVTVAYQAQTDALKNQVNSFNDFLDGLKREDDERQFQLSLLGKTTDQIALLTAAHQADLEVTRKEIELKRELRTLEDRGAAADDPRVLQIRAELALLPQLRDQRVAAAVIPRAAEIAYQNSFESGWKKAYDSYMQSVSAATIAQQAFNTLTQGLETLLINVANHAKNAWTGFRDSVIKMIEQIAAKLAVSGLLQLLNLGSGGFNFSIGGGGAGGVGGAAGGGLNLNSLLSLGSTASKLTGGAEAIGGVSSAALAGYAGASIPAATLGAGAAAEVGSAAAGAVTAGGIEAGLAAGLAAIPVYGWIALAAIIVGGIILGSKKGGGPQTREFGTSGADISTFGDLSATHRLVGTDAVRSAAYSNAALTAQATYDGVTKALGGVAGGAQFAIYTSQDLKGTASNQLDVRSTVGGQASYTANLQDVLGRDPEKLKAAIQLETQRAILGALQATDFPRYLADIFKTVDTATATEAQIANITATAVAIKQVVDTIPELAQVFMDLDAASTLALVDLVGGVQNFNQSMASLAANFETSGDKAAKAQLALVQSFEDLGLQVPKTHADFLALLGSFDLTTDSGRKLYAAVLALSGAFVQVKGTADQAAEALRQSVDALRGAKADYTGISQTPTAETQLGTAIQQFITDKPWAQAFVDAGGNLADTLSGILEDDFSHYSAADQALIIEIIKLAATVKNGATTIADSNQKVVDSNTAAVASYQALEQRANTEAAVTAKLTATGGALGTERAGLFGTLAGQAGGDFGQQIALQIAYITSEIAKLQSSRPTVKVAAEIKSLQDIGASLAQTLTFFADLKGRYGPQAAEQLVKLAQTYESQVKLLKGNAVALDLLHASFESQWNAIINGTASGVNGVQGELKRLQQSILDYVDSLKISDISPLTATQKLAEARRQYESDLAKAGTGDQKALGDVTGSADAFLKLARDFYASSSAYTNIFDMVTGQLTTLGTADLSAVTPPMNAADQALLDALPTGSKLMSAADFQSVAAYFSGLGDQTAAGAVLPPAPATAPAPPTGLISWWQATVPTGGTASTTTQSPEMLHLLHELAVAMSRSDAARTAEITAKIDLLQHALVEALTVGKK